LEKKLRGLFTWVVGPTVVGLLGQAAFGLWGGIIGSIAGYFVGWWFGRRYFP
jgi:hypothetical protein